MIRTPFHFLNFYFYTVSLLLRSSLRQIKWSFKNKIAITTNNIFISFSLQHYHSFHFLFSALTPCASGSILPVCASHRSISRSSHIPASSSSQSSCIIHPSARSFKSQRHSEFPRHCGNTKWSHVPNVRNTLII